jgi:uncharacterized protein (TIGR02246 family)
MHRRHAVLGLISLPVAGAAMTALAQPATTDHADIQTWLDQHAAAWNANDVPGMYTRAAPDLHWVNVVGMHWRGLPAVIHAHEVFFSIMFHDVSNTLLGVDSIVEIAPDVRICVARWVLGDYTTPSGDRIVAETNRMTLVFTGRDDGLLLRHVANLRIDADAARHDPAPG